ncbi:helix-turn-helix transcriptional regulator [Parvularcula oceani]|uniref:helix-turn-helix transcriptional regulator n=1 Tax=Parvularcula oceani TaxID=1247963 RepID=UPI0004E0D7A3|nr:helix-turn-helix transcriptional regulator [Parvularcula oceani]
MKGRLRELREAAGLSQKALGERVGVSRQAINAIENAKHVPSLDLAFRIAAVFSTPTEEIWPNPHRG